MFASQFVILVSSNKVNHVFSVTAMPSRNPWEMLQAVLKLVMGLIQFRTTDIPFAVSSLQISVQSKDSFV